MPVFLIKAFLVLRREKQLRFNQVNPDSLPVERQR